MADALKMLEHDLWGERSLISSDSLMKRVRDKAEIILTDCVFPAQQLQMLWSAVITSLGSIWPQVYNCPSFQDPQLVFHSNFFPFFYAAGFRIVLWRLFRIFFSDAWFIREGAYQLTELTKFVWRWRLEQQVEYGQ